MSAVDRQTWNRRYRDGAYQGRTHPSAFLEECADALPAPGRALDLACGTGRNAGYLAARGFSVDAVDISAEALSIGRERASALPIRWLEHDLDSGFAPDAGYDVIVNIRFVNLPLLESLVPWLRPNGVMIVEQHLATRRDDVIGPSNPAFRVAPGELARLASSLAIELCEEGFFADPDGRRAALSRLLARQPAPVDARHDSAA